MTIEESIKKDPSKFQAIVDAKAPEVRAAMQELSVRLDEIFNGAIKEYCEAEGEEADIAAIPTYKTMNKIITEKLDTVGWVTAYYSTMKRRIVPVKKFISLLLVLIVILCYGITVAENHASATEKQPDDVQTEDGKFTYIHDPREIPEAMKDIIENPDAIYGFSPNPQSTRLGKFAEIDWTDPEVVAQKTEERRAYHESMESMMDILRRMMAEGASMEEMARAISAERNRLRLASYQNDPETLAFAKQSNLQTYGNEEGPTPEWLYEKYGSWITVVQSAFSTNMGMDACCGLFDEYYWLYIELGLVEDNAAVSQ